MKQQQIIRFQALTRMPRVYQKRKNKTSHYQLLQLSRSKSILV